MIVAKLAARLVFTLVLAGVDMLALWYMVAKQGVPFEWAFAFLVFGAIAWAYVGLISGDEIK